MTNKIKVFENELFGKVRTMTIEGEPWFVGKDVADILGYSNSRHALAVHVHKDDRAVAKCDTRGGPQNMVIVNESGIYSLVFASKLPNARDFRHWITSEVIPSLRKYGGYILGQEKMSDTEMLCHAVIFANNYIDDLKKVVENQMNVIVEMEQKAVFADSVSDSESLISIGEMAKILKQNGMDIGEKRFFKYLRENNYLMCRTDCRNMPTQRAMELGIFRVIEREYTDSYGIVKVSRTTKVTGKGQRYFVDKFRSELNIMTIEELLGWNRGDEDIEI
ncbi:MAG: phage antirepressor KilAC domain-containing protein [Clostridia bacterium]|nr:phage antirepressor KilAC domain-containing protein [Clostridia bacterium]